MNAMTLRSLIRGASTVCATTAWMIACDPSNPCDQGYYEEHGACHLFASDADTPVDADGSPGDDDDAGSSSTDAAPNADPHAGFGDDCTEPTDCPDHLVCGAPMLPYCTAINCMDDPQLCPPDWMCFDTMGAGPDPSVTSVCLNL